MRNAILPALVGVVCLLGCAGVQGLREEEPARLTLVQGEGDPARRASLRFVGEGLDADVAGRGGHALTQYERAIQVDPTNPWAYLALSRHELDAGDAAGALAAVDQSRMLFESQDALSPGVEAHLDGLRGAALLATGRDGSASLESARRSAPGVWGDGRLDAVELR